MVGHVEVGLINKQPLMQIELTNGFGFFSNMGTSACFAVQIVFFAPNYERKGKTYDDFVAPISCPKKK